MKISGSRIEQISSMSMNLLRIKEQATITAVTQILSSEGKHVINIIHGTPSELLGSVYKDITFLWEADTESPEYLQAQEEKANAEAIAQVEKVRAETQARKEQQCSALEIEIFDLKRRIERAETGKVKGVAFGKYCYIFTIVFLILCVIGFSLIAYFAGGVLPFEEPIVIGFTVIAIFIIFFCIRGIPKENQKIKQARSQARCDSKYLLQLRKRLEAKQIELNKLKHKRNSD